MPPPLKHKPLFLSLPTSFRWFNVPYKYREYKYRVSNQKHLSKPRRKSYSNNRRSSSNTSSIRDREKFDRLWDVIKETRRMLHEIDERLSKLEEYIYRSEYKKDAQKE